MGRFGLARSGPERLDYRNGSAWPNPFIIGPQILARAGPTRVGHGLARPDPTRLCFILKIYSLFFMYFLMY